MITVIMPPCAHPWRVTQTPAVALRGLSHPLLPNHAVLDLLAWAATNAGRLTALSEALLPNTTAELTATVTVALSLSAQANVSLTSLRDWLLGPNVHTDPRVQTLLSRHPELRTELNDQIQSLSSDQRWQVRESCLMIEPDCTPNGAAPLSTETLRRTSERWVILPPHGPEPICRNLHVLSAQALDLANVPDLRLIADERTHAQMRVRGVKELIGKAAVQA